MMLAPVSDLGPKPLSAAVRQRIAQHLYGKGTWTMQAIADTLFSRREDHPHKGGGPVAPAEGTAVPTLGRFFL